MYTLSPNPLILDVNAVDRKGKPIENTFGHGFFWSEIIDAAADVYNGVCSTRPFQQLLLHLS